MHVLPPNFSAIRNDLVKRFNLDLDNPEDRRLLEGMLQASTHQELYPVKLQGDCKWTDLAIEGRLRAKEIEH